MPEHWRNLPAGPELDALVAERVLGWRPNSSNTAWHSNPDAPYSDREFLSRGKTPRFSTNWEGMGRVVEAMEKRGFCLHLERRYPGGPYVAWFSPPCVQVESDTAPLAVVRAALAVLEVE